MPRVVRMVDGCVVQDDVKRKASAPAEAGPGLLA